MTHTTIDLQMGVYIDIRGAGVALVNDLLELQQLQLRQGHRPWRMNTTGGGYFIGFIPSQSWPEAKAVLVAYGIYHGI